MDELVIILALFFLLCLFIGGVLLNPNVWITVIVILWIGSLCPPIIIIGAIIFVWWMIRSKDNC